MFLCKFQFLDKKYLYVRFLQVSQSWVSFPFIFAQKVPLELYCWFCTNTRKTLYGFCVFCLLFTGEQKYNVFILIAPVDRMDRAVARLPGNKARLHWFYLFNLFGLTLPPFSVQNYAQSGIIIIYILIIILIADLNYRYKLDRLNLQKAVIVLYNQLKKQTDRLIDKRNKNSFYTRRATQIMFTTTRTALTASLQQYSILFLQTTRPHRSSRFFAHTKIVFFYIGFVVSNGRDLHDLCSCIPNQIISFET